MSMSAEDRIQHEYAMLIQEIAQKTDPTTFTLEPETQALWDKIAQLQKECPHTRYDYDHHAFCPTCGKHIGGKR